MQTGEAPASTYHLLAAGPQAINIHTPWPWFSHLQNRDNKNYLIQRMLCKLNGTTHGKGLAQGKHLDGVSYLLTICCCISVWRIRHIIPP